MAIPPKETMQSLKILVSPELTTTPISQVLQLLNDHKAQLLSHIFPPSPSTKSEIRYRSKLPTTKSHPKTTPAETQWLAAHKLPLPKHLAALHLRDYIHSTYPTNAQRVLDSPSIMSFASSNQVLEFARDEIHAAYCVLNHILTDSNRDEFFVEFLNSNKSDIRDAIINTTNAVLSPAKPETESHMTADPRTVISLLLTSTVSEFLSLNDIIPIVKAYNTAAASPSRFSLLSLNNDSLSLYFLAAAFTTAIRHSIHLDSVIDSFRPLLTNDSDLSALVCLSLASILRLNYIHAADASVPHKDQSAEFMMHALSSDALGKLRVLLQYPRSTTDTKPINVMFRAFTEDLLTFLFSFPPRSLEHSQIEDLSYLVSSLMERSEATPLVDIANSLWDEGDKSELAKGVESILHLSSALYPLTFRPMIVLLRVLAVDTRCAAHALNYLENRMLTICEAAEGYSDIMTALDEDEDVIWSKLNDSYYDCAATRVLAEVKMGRKMTFVQAMRDIPGGTYRGALRAGALGVSDENFTTAAWVQPWNGFAAVVYALNTLRDILCNDVPPLQDFHPVMQDLVDSAIESLRFVEQLCLNGSDTLRRHICENYGFVETIARIVAEVLQLRGKAAFSLEWLQALLQSASRCLPAIVGEDVSSANSVANILADVVKRENFTAVLSSLGEIASLVLAAFVNISSLVSDGTLQDSSTDTMRNCKSYNGGADVFKEIITNMLCSESLINGSMTMLLDRESPTGWLLPLWSMHLFQNRPKVLLSSSAAVVLFATTILSTASQRPLSESESLLYPAACEAMIACANALRDKNQNSASYQLSNEKQQCISNKSQPTKLTALEEVLLRPDIVQAMTMICCGGAKRLHDNKLYSWCVDSKFRHLLPPQERTTGDKPHDRFLSYMISNRESTADMWLANMATRCLSLQMDCLSLFENQQDIPQVPWPSSSATVDANACIGAIVRERITKRISSGHGLDLLGLLVAILSCRQRAASRSLFGPQRSSQNHSDFVSCTPNDSQKAEKHNDLDSRQEKEPRDPMPAVIFCLRHTFHDCQELLRRQPPNEIDEQFRFLRTVGRLSTMVATCVRVLRLGLASQNSRWFQDYIETDFWRLLTSLVRCGPVNHGSASFDLKQITQDFLAFAKMGGLSKEAEPEVQEQVVLNADLVLDIASVWKGIAADVFRVMSREILAEATEDLLANRTDKSESEYHLPESLFQRPLFRSFADVFSETWVTALLGTEGLRQAVDRSRLATESRDAKRRKATPTLKQLTRRLSVRIMEITTGTPTDLDVLSKFDRSGDLAVPYGASYAFDVERLRQFLVSKKVSETLSRDVILAVIDLNMAISRQDVYVEVLSSFASMSSIILFVDSLCPTRKLKLSYSSAQFGGKLCRYLPKVVTSLLPDGAQSWHFFVVSLEVSKLLSMLSTRLTKLELEQSALTSLEDGNSLELPAELHLSTPLGHICHIITWIVSSEDTTVWGTEKLRSRHEIISWLLLTASRYTSGPAFHSTTDLQTLVRTCVRALKMTNEVSETLAAVSTALTESIGNMPDGLFSSTFTNTVITVLLAAVDAAASKSRAPDQGSSSRAIAGLLLVLARAVVRLQNVGTDVSLISLREVNASGVQPLLPRKGIPIEPYDFERNERNASHTLWCSVLQLAAVTVPKRKDSDGADMIGSNDTRYVVEFCSMHLERIVTDSLDLQSRQNEGLDIFSRHGRLNFQAVTLGKVEEAELGAVVLSRLSPFGVILQNSMPNTVRHAMEQLCRYTAQATGILRTDPVERWVRPITQRERERSGVAAEQLTSAIGALPIEQSTPNISPSPGRRTRSQLTPKRSPSQAIRAALNGKSRQGLMSSPGPVLTPLMSPMPNVRESQKTPPYFSPNALWGHHGSGLITRTGECFAEEVSMSLIRGLCAALNGIRQLSEQLGIYPFQPTMEPTGDAPGIGTLLAILKFSCWELNKEGNEVKRAYVQGIADTAMHLTLSHAMTQAETGALSQSVRDEVRKRVTTILYRANNLDPPLPASSILRDDGLMSVWKRF